MEMGICSRIGRTGRTSRTEGGFQPWRTALLCGYKRRRDSGELALCSGAERENSLTHLNKRHSEDTLADSLAPWAQVAAGSPGACLNTTACRVSKWAEL